MTLFTFCHLHESSFYKTFLLEIFGFVFSDSNLIIDLSFTVLFFAVDKRNEEQKYYLLSRIFGTISENSHSTEIPENGTEINSVANKRSYF